MNTKQIARSFAKDQHQPELGVIENPVAVAAFERAFGLLAKRSTDVLAIPISDREANAIFGRVIPADEPGDCWLAVGLASSDEALFLLTRSNEPTGHADALDAFHNHYLAPASNG